MILEVRKELFAMQDKNYQTFQSKLCPGVTNMIGVPIPKLRKIVNYLLKKDYITYLKEVDNTYYEETMIEGIIIASCKMNMEEKISYLKNFIPKIDNWSVCDIVVSSFKLKEKDRKILWDFIVSYQDTNQEYLLRFMVVTMLNNYLTDEDVDHVFKIIDKIHVDYYYTNMAIAWLISIAFIKQKEKTIKYLQNNHLSEFTYQKALQKIVESTRVTPEEKLWAKEMKKQSNQKK